MSEKERAREEEQEEEAQRAAAAATATATAATTTATAAAAAARSSTSPATSSPPEGAAQVDEAEDDEAKLSTFPGVGIGVEVTAPSPQRVSAAASSSMVSVHGSGKAVFFSDEEGPVGPGGTGSSSGSLGGGSGKAPAASSSQKTMSLRDRLAGKAASAKAASVATLTASGKDTTSSSFGDRSREIESASFLSNHVVVFGCSLNIETFVAEIRRPVVSLCCYRPIVYVGLVVPEKWEKLTKTYDDVYWLSGVWLHPINAPYAHILPTPPPSPFSFSLSNYFPNPTYPILPILATYCTLATCQATCANLLTSTAPISSRPPRSFISLIATS